MLDTFVLNGEFWSGLFDWRGLFENDVSLVLTLLGILIPALLALRRLRQIAHDTRAHYDWTRKENVLDYSISRAQAYREARHRLSVVFGSIYQANVIPLSVIDEAIEKDPRVSVDLSIMFGHFDNLAIAIDQDIVDHKVGFLMMSEPVCGAYHAFEEYLERSERRNPMSYRHLRKLVKVWRPVRAQRRKAMRTSHRPPYGKLDAPLKV